MNLTFIEITWQPINCIQRNSIIRYYSVYYRKVTDAIDTLYTNTSITTVTILNLNPNTEYLVSVEAVSESKWVSPSAQLNASTEVPTGTGKAVAYYLFSVVMIPPSEFLTQVLGFF